MAELTRAEYVAGVRRFADWMEAHPEVPAPPYVTVFAWGHLHSATQAATLLRALGHADKEWQDNYLVIVHDFGGIELRAVFTRSNVCTRRVIGTEEVAERLLPAHTREIVEWDCLPILTEDAR